VASEGGVVNKSPIEEGDFDPLEPTSEELLGEWDLFVQRYGWEQARLRWLAIAVEEREKWRSQRPWPMPSSEIDDKIYHYDSSFWSRIPRLKALKEAMRCEDSFKRIAFYEHAGVWIEIDSESHEAVLVVPSPILMDNPPLPDAWANRTDIAMFASNECRFYLLCCGDSFTFVFHPDACNSSSRAKKLESLWASLCAPILAERGFVLWPDLDATRRLLIHEPSPAISPDEMSSCMNALAHGDVPCFLRRWGDVQSNERFKRYRSTLTPLHDPGEVRAFMSRLDEIDPPWRARWMHPVWRERWMRQVTGGGRQDLAWPVKEAL